MDRFYELDAFISVVEAGGFSAAARRMGASQSAVSKAVGALEQRLGVALFNRSTRSVTLTDHGQSYYDRIKPLIGEMDEADSDLTSHSQAVSGPVRIATASTFGRLHVLPLIPIVLSLNPGLEIDLVLSDSVRDMVEDRIDLAIRVGPVNDVDSIVKHIASTPLVCVGSRRYFEQHGTPKEPSELADHNCLLYGGLVESSNWPFHGPDGRFSVAVRGNLSSNSVETVRSAVLAGVGIGLFAKVSLAEELKHPDVVTILNDFIRDARDVSIIWPRRRFVSARVRRVTEFFAAALPQRL